MTNKEKLERLVKAGKDAEKAQTAWKEFCEKKGTQCAIEQREKCDKYYETKRAYEEWANYSRQAIEEMLAENERLKEALELNLAMDLPHKEGSRILEKAGWSYEDRFDLSASEFVKQKAKQALGESE